MLKKNKIKKTSFLDAADVPIQNPSRPLQDTHTDATRPNVKLRSLVDQGKYEEARTLFIEIVKSNKYHFKNLWRIGIEIIGKSSPKDLLGYLKAVYISSPPSFSTETFNVYTDQLMLEEQWEQALEEMQIRYTNPSFHHPIVLRKMAICSYKIWQDARNKLPESYFEPDERDAYSLSTINYEKHTRVASKYLSEAHSTYLRDAELLYLHFNLLELTENLDIAKQIVLASLKAYEEDPDYYLLFALIRVNKKINVFNEDDYILQLYGFDPFLDFNVMKLDQFCKRKCTEIINILGNVDSTMKELEIAYDLALTIFKLYIFRLEHGNPEDWFQEVIMELFNNAMSSAIAKTYENHQIDTLLRSNLLKTKFKQDWAEQFNLMKHIVENFDDENNTDVSMEEYVSIKEEPSVEIESSIEEEDEYETNDEELYIERETFMI